MEVDEGPEKYNDWLDFVVEDITDANEQFGAPHRVGDAF